MNYTEKTLVNLYWVKNKKLKNVIIVDTPDVLLVADKSKAKDVKKIIDKLKEEGKHHLL